MTTNLSRRTIIQAFTASIVTGALAGRALAQQGHFHKAPFSTLRGTTVEELAPHQIGQRQLESPAPKGPQGRWEARAALPLPRSEMAWATALNGRMHVVGG